MFVLREKKVLELNNWINMGNQEPEATCNGNSICSFLQANNHVRPLPAQLPGGKRGGVLQVRGLHPVLGPVGPLRRQVHHPGPVRPVQGGPGAQADPPQYCESVPPVKKCSSSLEIAYTSHQVFKGEKKIQSRWGRDWWRLLTSHQGSSFCYLQRICKLFHTIGDDLRKK